MSDSSIGIILLAAGPSTRMGVAKQLLRYKDKTLLRRAIDGAVNSQGDPVIVVLGANVAELRGEIQGSGVSMVINEAWTEGMASSIRCGIAALEELTAGKAGAAVLILCDQPFVSSDTIDRLIEVHRANGFPGPLIASEYKSNGENIRGVPALFSRRLFPELMNLHGSEGAKRIIAKYSKDSATIEAPEAALDIDTPEDYLNLQSRNPQLPDA